MPAKKKITRNSSIFDFNLGPNSRAINVEGHRNRKHEGCDAAKKSAGPLDPKILKLLVEFVVSYPFNFLDSMKGFRLTIKVENRGKAAPNRERRNACAATAEAALNGLPD